MIDRTPEQMAATLVEGMVSLVSDFPGATGIDLAALDDAEELERFESSCRQLANGLIDIALHGTKAAAYHEMRALLQRTASTQQTISEELGGMGTGPVDSAQRLDAFQRGLRAGLATKAADSET